MIPPHAQRLLGDGAGRRRSRALVDLLPVVPSFGDQLLGGLGLALQPGQPGSWYIRATVSPAASRSRMTTITWRLAAAFCSNAQVGSRSSPARISAWVITGYGRVLGLLIGDLEHD